MKNDIFMDENENSASKITWNDFFAPDVFMENRAMYNSMHGILIHENFVAKLSSSCMEMSLSWMGISF